MAGTSYYGDQISENVVITDEGYRICKNAVLARTGFQMYKVSELSPYIREKLDAMDLGLTDGDEVEFYRSAKEVFAPAFLASLEGKPLTDEHPEDMVSAETHQEHAVGHIQRVREGDEPLKSGDMPLMGDVHITHCEAAEKHKAGRRELSCGYTYDIRRDGKRILQVDMIANHVALVPKGRAGKEVGIYDAAPQDVQREPFDMSKLLESIRKKGWLAWAKDAKPEEVADAMTELEAKTSKDAEEDKHPVGCRCSDCKADGKDALALKAAKDAAAVAAKPVAADEGEDDEDEVSEADVKEALATLREAFEQDEEEDDEDEGEGEDSDDDDDDEDEKDKRKKGEGEDAEIVTPVDPLDKADRPKSAIATDSAVAILKILRPTVARSRDHKLRAAFDSCVKLTSTSSARRASDASYGKVLRASQRPGGSALDSSSKPRSEELGHTKLEEAYATHRGKTLGTVK